MVNVPPRLSVGSNRPSLAFVASILTSDEMDASPFFSAFRTTGTIRPAGVCTATLTCAA